MSNSNSKSPGRPRSLQSHQAMLQATLELLGDVGFEGISMDAIAARAGVGKTTIYRRYASKSELVADAIESLRDEIVIPDTGQLHSDMEAIVQQAADMTLSPLGRQTIAMIISSATTNQEFAQLYWTKYLQPRRQTFALVIDRAKARQEVHPDLDSDLIFDLISGLMLYALLVHPTPEAWKQSVHQGITLLLDKSILISENTTP
jgi:AcrR family transcriptional regulator